MARIFVDTNVLLDVILEREPFVEDSSTVWGLVERGVVPASISAISISNIFYIARKAVGGRKAKSTIQGICQVFTLQACDSELIHSALTHDLSDFEDGIQYAAAERARARLIVTRNVSHFPHDGIPVLTPSAYLAQR